MFYEHLDDRTKLWLFHLTTGKQIIGSVEKYAKDTNDNVSMLWVWSSEFITFVSIPWHSVSFIQRYGEK